MGYRNGTKFSGTFKGDAALLADPGQVALFLRRLVVEIGMTALGHHIYDVPIAVKRLGQDPLSDEGGVTGITVLSTSHAAIHTWPEVCGGRIDVDSCREFEGRLLHGLLRTMFNAREIYLYDLSFCFKPPGVVAIEVESPEVAVAHV